jgi:hypothetical protein
VAFVYNLLHAFILTALKDGRGFSIRKRSRESPMILEMFGMELGAGKDTAQRYF